MDKDDKDHARRMRWWRFGLRAAVITVLFGLVIVWSNRLAESLYSAKLPGVCVLTTEEAMADGQNKPVNQPPAMPPGPPVVDTSPTTPPLGAVANGTSEQASKEISPPHKRVIKRESSWVQFAHSALLLGTQVVVLVVLIWGIISVAKQED